MNNNDLNLNIVRQFKLQFEKNCIHLLIEGYRILKDKSKLKELSENNITVQLVKSMKTIPERVVYQISLNREAYYDDDDIYSGLKDADKSVRIDIKYSTWSSNFEYEYFMEAKNLSENDWVKSHSNVKVKSLSQCKRYIETGILNFISGIYPHGCLVGYVVEGTQNGVVNRINNLLSEVKRDKEHLINEGNNFRYISKHIGSSIENLEHYFLTFN